MLNNTVVNMLGHQQTPSLSLSQLDKKQKALFKSTEKLLYSALVF